MTRRERRASRQRRFVTATQARLDYKVSSESGALRETAYERPLPGWLRPLDYKLTNESGALKVPSRIRTWHLNGRANGHKPPPGQTWDQSGPTYVVESAEMGRLEKPIIHHLWRRLMADK